MQIIRWHVYLSSFDYDAYLANENASSKKPARSARLNCLREKKEISRWVLGGETKGWNKIIAVQHHTLLTIPSFPLLPLCAILGVSPMLQSGLGVSAGGTQQHTPRGEKAWLQQWKLLCWLLLGHCVSWIWPWVIIYTSHKATVQQTDLVVGLHNPG